MKRKMYHFPETRMHKNGRPRVLGDTFPVMKEMKEKNLHRAPPRPPAPAFATAGGGLHRGPPREILYPINF
jgi:hypothetical protein